MKKHAMIVSLFLFVWIVISTGCSSSSDDGDNVSDAKKEVVDNVSQKVATSFDKILGQVLDSEATSTLTESLSFGGGSDLGGMDLSGLFEDVDTEELSTNLEEILDDLMSNPVVDGDTITFTPNTTELCVDIEDAAERQLCEQMLNRISLVQNTDNNTLTVMFDDHAPLIVGYGQNSVYFEVDLTETVAVAGDLLAALDAGISIDFPETFEGAVRLTMASTDTTGTVTLGVTDTIRIGGEVDGEQFSIEVAETDKVIEISGDGNTATVELGLGAVTGGFPLEDDDEIMHVAELSLAGINAFMQLQGNTIEMTGLNLGNDPVTFDIDGQAVFEASMDTLDLTVNGTDGSLTFSTGDGTDFVLELSFANTSYIDFLEDFIDEDIITGAVGGLTIAIADDTELAFIVDEADPFAEALTKVVSGSIDFTGTGFFDGTASYSADDCYTDSSTAGFPVEAVTCP